MVSVLLRPSVEDFLDNRPISFCLPATNMCPACYGVSESGIATFVEISSLKLSAMTPLRSIKGSWSLVWVRPDIFRLISLSLPFLSGFDAVSAVPNLGFSCSRPTSKPAGRPADQGKRKKLPALRAYLGRTKRNTRKGRLPPIQKCHWDCNLGLC